MLVFQSNDSLSLMLPKLEKWNSKSLSLAFSLENLKRRGKFMIYLKLETSRNDDRYVMSADVVTASSILCLHFCKQEVWTFMLCKQVILNSML